jgi:lycopene cyclase domain-containing protein
MTYALVSLPFLAVALIVLLVALLRRPQARGRRLAAAGVAFAVLVVLTAVFDNIMIAAGLFEYSSAHRSGVSVGLAPIEDFLYPLAGVLLLPALWTLLERPTRD